MNIRDKHFLGFVNSHLCKNMSETEKKELLIEFENDYQRLKNFDSSKVFVIKVKTPYYVS